MNYCIARHRDSCSYFARFVVFREFFASFFRPRARFRTILIMFLSELDASRKGEGGGGVLSRLISRTTRNCSCRCRSKKRTSLLKVVVSRCVAREYSLVFRAVAFQHFILMLQSHHFLFSICLSLSAVFSRVLFFLDFPFVFSAYISGYVTWMISRRKKIRTSYRNIVSND